MGVYLSAPEKKKESTDEVCKSFTYGASSMQGWRISQEDAHNCIPKFNAESNTSFFAVYDGHGGAEVAKYCEKHFPEFIKLLIESQKGKKDVDLEKIIKSAFLAFDATLTQDEVISELKELSGKDDLDEEDDEDDPVGRTETDCLKEEANMPLDELLAKYGKKEDAVDTGAGGSGEGPSGSGASGSGAKRGQFISPALRSKGHSRTSSSSSSQDGEMDAAGDSKAGSSSSSSSSSPVSRGKKSKVSANGNNSNGLSNGLESDGSASKVDDKESPPGKSGSSSSGGSSSATDSGSGSSSKAGGSDSTGGSGSVGGSGSAKGSGSSSSVSNEKAIDDDDDDDTSDEDQEDWEDMSDDDDDDDDDSDEEEENDENVPMMDMTEEEPGSDSGCTACVLLLQDKRVVCANAGDSRCVLARGGKALELSFDHKPEDDPERQRIEKAGGKVTSDGRVNGGLNLSRAIGDHVYKRNTDLPAKDQMITALPDIETTELTGDDQFFVIACDGIWNYLTSQEVVDYVLPRLQDPEKRSKPSLICEELFEHCLAPNTQGDGTGCDNMTCIIIVLDSFKPGTVPPLPAADGEEERGADDSQNKRPAEEAAGSLEKKQKVDQEND